MAKNKEYKKIRNRISNSKKIPDFSIGCFISGLGLPWNNSFNADVEQELEPTWKYKIIEVDSVRNLIKLDGFTEWVRIKKVKPLNFKK